VVKFLKKEGGRGRRDELKEIISNLVQTRTPNSFQ
jgi:hypothetical protein